MKEHARRIFFGIVVDSIVLTVRTRDASTTRSAPSSSSGEVRGCESWQWCGPADEE